MARINLLPWREELRKEQQKTLLTVTGLSAILMVLVIVAVYLEIGRQVSSQQSRNAYLQNEIGKVEKKIAEIQTLEKEKKQLLKRMDVIQRLQRNRPEVVHLFDEIPKMLPEGMYLTSIRQNNRNLLVEGVAQSNARVSAFMRNIEESPWVTDPQLDIIQADKKIDYPGARKFTLRARQVLSEDNAPDRKKR